MPPIHGPHSKRSVPPPSIPPVQEKETVESLTAKIRALQRLSALQAQSEDSPTPKPTPSKRKKINNPSGLRIPQARVLYVLLDEEGDRRIMRKDEISVALGYSPISGTTNRVLYGILEGSLSGHAHPGLLQLGLIEELALDVDGSPSSTKAGERTILHYRITAEGREALSFWLSTHELPELRDKDICTNQRYAKAVASAPSTPRKDGIE